ncbi:hypothetical protein [Peribacillus frigoritolerans]|uniref:hypothetical protein n=1 Tax=Peribacillus frigoritolerans TaxID=450367 RepID=UPI00207A8BA6|nr:hypothetical protein [Peribacillus frigoritolerans]USK76635.1 hypothetical protein LIT31_08845 [Peribacillus frigoritolerans]
MDDGNPKKNKEGNFAIENANELLKQQKEYFQEYYTIEGDDAHGMLKTMKDVIGNYDLEISRKDAEVFEYLFIAFGKSNETGEEIMLEIQMTTTNIRYADGGVSSVSVQFQSKDPEGSINLNGYIPLTEEYQGNEALSALTEVARTKIINRLQPKAE